MRSYPKTVVRTLGFACCFAVSSAEAAAPRAYVSVNGNDLNTCNVPATPCRTYTGAISQVTPGGEVIVLDSGTFGGGTISQSVTINAPAGVVALAATTILVNPGSGNVVVLRGLTFQSPTPGTGTGIVHVSGTLFVENIVVDGWLDGLLLQNTAAGLYVKGSVFRNQFQDGLRVDAIAGAVRVAVDGSFFEKNARAGVYFLTGVGHVADSQLNGNYFGAVVGASGVAINFERCGVSNNTSTGLWASNSAEMRVGQSRIVQNGVGLHNNSSLATVTSFGNNIIRGNSNDTVGTVTTLPLQ